MASSRESRAISGREEREACEIPFEGFFKGLTALVYFIVMPLGLMIFINWIAYWLTASTFYSHPWMMPGLLLLSTFLGGALIRQKMEEYTGGIGLFCMALLALAIFSWLTYMDINTLGRVYSHAMPAPLKYGLEDFVWMLPAVGILGMLFYKYFTLKHYD